MNKLKTIWLLLLATLLVGTICWSIITLTVKTGKLVDNITITYSQASNWFNALFPPELCSDLRKNVKEYYEEYGKDCVKYFFDILKGETAIMKLQNIP